MNSVEIRQSFLDFFERKGHKIVSSSSLLPESPNLLFTNAGMNQFVPIFLGERVPTFRRAADTQKCIRAGGKHNDLEDVGFDTYHHTFFEMLGNWSFGDYFKQGAIEYAWELLTKVWKMPKERLYVTVYNPGPGDPAVFDQEAYGYWESIFRKEGIDPERHILKFGKKENFWMMGDTGPCGPCTEIHMDLTPNGDTGGALVNRDSPLCIEIWNLVFMQFNAQADGQFVTLKEKHVDTGMGFERVVGIANRTKQFTDFSKSPSNYDSDLFRYIFDELEHLSGKSYKGTVAASREHLSEQEKIDFAFRVLADHLRALTFAIADGILPSNEGRHYVLRRILRRAAVFARWIDLPAGSFNQVGSRIIEEMSSIFPELMERRAIILTTIQAEERMFEKTLGRGITLLEGMFTKLEKAQERVLLGADVFLLYDTYGFPFDLTQLMAKERGFKVDEIGFQAALEEQRERARRAQKKEQITVTNTEADLQTQFIGYDQQEKVQAKVVQVLPQKKGCLVIVDKTPFYGEMGGEVGDTGTLRFRDQTFEIIDTLRDTQGNSLHKISQTLALSVGDEVELTVDVGRRKEIQRHHTATHLLHAALRKILGTHVKQNGSFVSDRGLRFDFNHFAALKKEEIEAIEQFVNDAILDNLPVSTQEMSFRDIPEGCVAFFNEKYGEIVRVVSVDDVSMELCGGCHAHTTGELGLFKIVKESAIAAGIRRIEAVVGEACRTCVNRRFDILDRLANQYAVKDEEIIPKIHQQEEKQSATERRLRSVLALQNQQKLDQIHKQISIDGDLKMVKGVFEVESANDLRSLSSQAMKQFGADIVIFAGNLIESSIIAVTCSEKAVNSGKVASTLIAKVAETLGGKGGGNQKFGMANIPHRLQEGDLNRF